MANKPLGSSCLHFLIAGMGCLYHYVWHLYGFWRSELRCSRVHSKSFNDQALSPHLSFSPLQTRTHLVNFCPQGRRAEELALWTRCGWNELHTQSVLLRFRIKGSNCARQTGFSKTNSKGFPGVRGRGRDVLLICATWYSCLWDREAGNGINNLFRVIDSCCWWWKRVSEPGADSMSPEREVRKWGKEEPTTTRT